MRKRERISSTAAVVLIAAQIVVILIDGLFNLIALFPFIGIVGTLLSAALSFVWAPILFFTLLYLTGSSGRMFWRMTTVALVASARVFASAIPMAGGIIEFFLACIEVVLLFLYIRKVQAEDREYNEKNGLA